MLRRDILDTVSSDGAAAPVVRRQLLPWVTVSANGAIVSTGGQFGLTTAAAAIAMPDQFGFKRASSALNSFTSQSGAVMLVASTRLLTISTRVDTLPVTRSTKMATFSP
jgi:hypothetical protein